VARVRLRVDDHDRPAEPIFLLFDPRLGATERVPILRLVTTVLLGPEPAIGVRADRQQADAVIDTGAWVSVVKKEVWEKLDEQGLVEHLERREPDGTPRDGFTLLGGQRLAVTFGRIWMGLTERNRPVPGVLPRRAAQLPAVSVLCQLLRDEETVLKSPVLLGLHRGVFDGRQLRRVPVPVQPTPDDRNDVGPRYGQQWWLQDES
jgi:hypothetical protein